MDFVKGGIEKDVENIKTDLNETISEIALDQVTVPKKGTMNIKKTSFTGVSPVLGGIDISITTIIDDQAKVKVITTVSLTEPSTPALGVSTVSTLKNIKVGENIGVNDIELGKGVDFSIGTGTIGFQEIHLNENALDAGKTLIGDKSSKLFELFGLNKGKGLPVSATESVGTIYQDEKTLDISDLLKSQGEAW